MAIVFVGGVEGSAANGGNVTLDLTALTGGASATAATGDVVIVLGAMSASQTVSLPASYNLLDSATSVKIGWKMMPATADTSVVVTGSGSGTNSTAGIAFVYRGVDPGSLLATSATGSSTNPDPPSITTVTPNAVVVACMATQVLDTAVTCPSGYAHQFDVAGDDNNDITIGMSDISVASPSTENPAAWTNVSTAGWRAVTIRIHEAKPFLNDQLPDANHIRRAGAPSDPPNLQASTLAPVVAGTPSIIYRIPLIGNAREAKRPVWFDIAPNLFGNTLAPAAPPAGAPFFGATFETPRRTLRVVPLISPDRVATAPTVAGGDPLYGYSSELASVRLKPAKPFDPPNLALRPEHFLVHVWAGTSDKRRSLHSDIPPNTLLIGTVQPSPFFATDWPNTRLRRLVATAPHFIPNLLPLLLSTEPADSNFVLSNTLDAATLEATLGLASWTPQSGSTDGWTSQTRGSDGWTQQSGSSDGWTEQ